MPQFSAEPQPVVVSISQGVDVVCHIDLYPLPDGGLGVATDLSGAAHFPALFATVCMMPFFMLNHIDRPSKALMDFEPVTLTLFEKAQMFLRDVSREQE